MESSLDRWTLDHVVIIVDDLPAAIRAFEALGFHVVPGGRTGPVHNALIYFADATYIELTSPVSRATRMLFRLLRGLGILHLFERVQPGLMHRFYAWFGGPTGLQDWCVRVPDLDACRRAAEKSGTRMAEARSFQRTRLDGAVAEWRLTAPSDRQQPFWIEDVSPADRRVPWREHCVHPIGVEGIRAIVVTAAPSGVPGGVSFRVAEHSTVHRLRLELHAPGRTPGPLPLAQTANAWIELVQ